MSDTTAALFNYLVPAAGTTRGYIVSEVLSAAVKSVDFRQFALDGKPFIPSGVLIDNTRGTGPVQIVINEIAWQIVCPAGNSMGVQYPAPSDQTANISGLGQATIAFVDFPVIPFVNTGNVGAFAGVTIANGADVAEGATTDAPVSAMQTAAAATQIALLKGMYNQLFANGNGQFVQGNVASGVADAGNPVKIGGVYASNPTNVASGQRVDLWVTPKGGVVIAGSARAANDGQSNTLNHMPSADNASTTPLAVANYNFNGTTWDRSRGTTDGTSVVDKPVTSGGVASAKIISAAGTNATSVKASAGQVYGGRFFNTGAMPAFLKLYNKATAPVVGTDIPTMIIGIGSGQSATIPVEAKGTPFSAGIAYAITGSFADSDTTAVILGQVTGNLFTF